MAIDPFGWDARYLAGSTPWDFGRPLPLLLDALDEGALGAPGRAFCPGAGRGHDASGLAGSGWDVTVVDLSPTAAAYAAEHYPQVRYAVGDALDPDLVLAQTGGPVDLLWDHTFFCAVPPAMRPRMGDLARGVVRPGGLLASGVFPTGRPMADGGPPYSYDVADMTAVLDDFDLVRVSEPVQVSPLHPWPHRLAVWRRR
jgi:hypothetical protein